MLLAMLINIYAIGQDKEYSLAKVGKKIHGVYIFIRSEPYNEYDYIATVRVNINWTGTTEESFEKAIKKSKKKYPYFNGMIFQHSDFSKVDLIRFKGLDVSRGGFTVGSKISFIEGNRLNFGEVAALETSKGKASIKYVNIYGEEKIKQLHYTDLTPLSEDEYKQKVTDFKKTIEKYKFKMGDEVTWIITDMFGQNAKQMSGEIVDLDNNYHRASVKYTDENNEQKVMKVSYLKLTKKE